MIRLIFRWYDFYVGLFWDKQKKWLYIFPIPSVGILIKFRNKNIAAGLQHIKVDVRTFVCLRDGGDEIREIIHYDINGYKLNEIILIQEDSPEERYMICKITKLTAADKLYPYPYRRGSIELVKLYQGKYR